MLSSLIKDQLALGLAQAGVTFLLAVGVVWLARRQKIQLEKETLIALGRGIIQVILAGLALLFLLEGNDWLGIPVLAAMLVAASLMARQRAKSFANVLGVCWWGISGGTGPVILLMVAVGVIETRLSSLIPLSSMLIAQSMSTCGQALERFQAEIIAHANFIEAGLTLGASPATMVAPYAQKAVYASLIPRLDSLTSLGIIWLPGLMAGMILSGANPVYAAVYQFAALAMIFAASGLTALITIILVRSKVFSKADQLILKTGRPTKTS